MTQELTEKSIHQLPGDVVVFKVLPFVELKLSKLVLVECKSMVSLFFGKFSSKKRSCVDSFLVFSSVRCFCYGWKNTRLPLKLPQKIESLILIVQEKGYIMHPHLEMSPVPHIRLVLPNLKCLKKCEIYNATALVCNLVLSNVQSTPTNVRLVDVNLVGKHSSMGSVQRFLSKVRTFVHKGELDVNCSMKELQTLKKLKLDWYPTRTGHPMLDCSIFEGATNFKKLIIEGQKVVDLDLTKVVKLQTLCISSNCRFFQKTTNPVHGIGTEVRLKNVHKLSMLKKLQLNLDNCNIERCEVFLGFPKLQYLKLTTTDRCLDSFGFLGFHNFKELHFTAYVNCKRLVSVCLGQLELFDSCVVDDYDYEVQKLAGVSINLEWDIMSLIYGGYIGGKGRCLTKIKKSSSNNGGFEVYTPLDKLCPYMLSVYDRYNGLLTLGSSINYQSTMNSYVETLEAEHQLNYEPQWMTELRKILNIYSM